MQRFLARVFAEPGMPWILKGGTGLLVRLPGARHSEDVDLLHLEADLEQAFAELRELTSATTALDPLTFQVTKKDRDSEFGSLTLRLRATPYFGTNPAQSFPIDLTSRRELVGAVDLITPVQVLDIEDVSAPPLFACYPLADQIADKVAAMYERHGARELPSTRWRDLADLLMLIRTVPFDAADTCAALAEQPARRPGLRLPAAVESPGEDWNTGYGKLAKTTTLPPELHSLDAALVVLGHCVNPLLDRSVETGTWNPVSRAWSVN
ncbi:nucleotidyl transferase AbiEii/AbiGii toxin family protein [Nocardia sp. NPDC058640]|uniref:nucleotidyl transferase AbiEii/AbiGii toxin family protein n=1 Tax=Nocardia sp. NPDC058640 TaxID=3346571 RepID=UPI00365008ED